MRICVVRNGPLTYSETFIRQHVTDLPAETVLLDDWPPWARSKSPWATTLPARTYRRARRVLSPQKYQQRITATYVQFFRRQRIEVVLAEFGPSGVAVMRACRELNLPLVVHFHGYDVSVHRVLEQYSQSYSAMFRQAAALIAVSHDMQKKLIEMGAPPERLYYNPCGVDCESFSGADPSTSAPQVLAVGRFVETKGPQVTVAAFADVVNAYPEARLRMIGDGPLLEECRGLVRSHAIEHAVTFLGIQPHHVVANEMRASRLFAQHSLKASSGAVEGTPVAILEAGASGLPVVATYQGGIPEVVTHNETGLLVNDRHVAGMAAQMLRLLRDPNLAAELGRAARERVRRDFSSVVRIDALWTIIKNCLPPRSL
jgi:glycosyltransferase involved in cell wall biosynthesis